jgi:nitrogen fixation NifU-like protein
MSSDLYHEVIIEEFQNRQNQGQLADADISLHNRNSSCGDEVTVYLKFDSTGQIIEQVKWEGDGCAISIAATSLLSAYIMGKTVIDVLALQKKDLEQMLGIDEIAYGREKCLLLGLQTIQKAIKTAKAELEKS